MLDAVNTLAINVERRKTFEVYVDDIQSRYRALFPNPGLFEHDAVEGALAAIYNKLQDVRTTPDISALLQSLYEVVDTALTTEGPSTAAVAAQPVKRYDLSKIDFTRLKAEFEKTPHKAVVVLNLQEQLEQRLAAMVAVNPTRVDLYQRYQEIVAEYNRDKDAAEVQKVMDDLFALNDKLNDEEKRYLREGLDNDAQLAVFDLLQKDSLTKGDREKIKKVAKDLLDTLARGKLQIDHWREKAAAQAQVKAEIIKHLWANLPDGAYAAEEIDLKAGAVFAHIFTTSGGNGTTVYH